MKQVNVDAKVAELRAEGKTDAEIRKALFQIKGVKLAQMRKSGI